MPRPLLCPPSWDHPPCPPDSCVSDWGPESTPNPACSGARVFLSPLPLPHFSGSVESHTPPQPRPGLCIPPAPPVDMNLVLPWVAPPVPRYQPPCIPVPWREALRADQTCKWQEAGRESWCTAG